MTPNLNHFYVARLTLETKTPLSIAAGQADGVFDVALVRDANGLPAIPGSSLAGVLRHLCRSVYGEAVEKALFGWREKDEGEASRLHVSWGAIQDSSGKPVEGLLLGKERRRAETDPLLRAALETANSPEFRDRVRISHRGAAADTGKFDRAVLPAGYRFSAEISLWSEQASDPRWEQLLSLFLHPLFRLGGATRAGLGRLLPDPVHVDHFDLTDKDRRSAFAELPAGIGDVTKLTKLDITPPAQGNRFVTATLKLTPRGFWRIGQGEAGECKDTEGKPADLLPKLEARVRWQNGRAGVGADELLVPASSVKGALAHRVAFHANRLAGRWAETMTDLDTYDKSEHCHEVQTLFGFAQDDKTRGDGEEKGRAGRLYIDDVFIEYAARDVQMMMHNSIDRFTGGVREHMLFSEELVWRKGITLRLTVDTKGVCDATRHALALALDDLCKGRLALGGGAVKGHGFFDGEIAWSEWGRQD